MTNALRSVVFPSLPRYYGTVRLPDGLNSKTLSFCLTPALFKQNASLIGVLLQVFPTGSPMFPINACLEVMPSVCRWVCSQFSSSPLHSSLLPLHRVILPTFMRFDTSDNGSVLFISSKLTCYLSVAFLCRSLPQNYS